MSPLKFCHLKKCIQNVRWLGLYAWVINWGNFRDLSTLAITSDPRQEAEQVFSWSFSWLSFLPWPFFLKSSTFLNYHVIVVDKVGRSGPWRRTGHREALSSSSYCVCKALVFGIFLYINSVERSHSFPHRNKARSNFIRKKQIGINIHLSAITELWFCLISFKFIRFWNNTCFISKQPLIFRNFKGRKHFSVLTALAMYTCYVTRYNAMTF